MEEQIMKECSKWKSGKRFLTAAITLSLLGSLGLYSPAAYAEEDFEEYTGSITGKEDNASEYVMAHITKDGGKNYKFTDDSLIKTNQGVKVGDLDYPVNIDASGHVLKFYGHVNDKHTLVHAVEANSKKGVTITAKKLIIDAGNTKSRAEGISVGGQGGTNKDAPYRLTINGDTDIRAHGANYGLGMYLCGNAEVTINGNVTMNTHDEKNPWAVYVENDGGFSYYGGSAIYAGNNYELQLGPKLTVNGLVDLKVNANGVFANGGHSDIYFRGGNIEINKDNTKGYYALLAECATTTMNMERDENKVPVRAGSAKVTIKGNVGASAKAHGEGLLVKGDNLYALASINKEGGYQNYDEGWLIRYRIGQDGSLERKDYTRVGKNTDEARLNLYNDHILVSAIGGYQNYGFGNGDTCITAATLSDNGGLSTGNTRNITLPNTFTNEQGAKDFRDLKVLPDGTAYVMRYNLGGAGGVEMDVYQTTVSNLMSENPVSWGNPVSSGTYDGWFGKLNAEYHTHRLWVEAGQNLLVYKDGNTTPQSWRATDFSNNSGMFQFNFMAMLQPDKVKGALASLSAVRAEGLTARSLTAVRTANPDAVMRTPDYQKQITGTIDDEDFETDDNLNYTFVTDKVIQPTKDNYKTGDRVTNVLAAVDAHEENDVIIHAGTHALQLQSAHTIGSPAGIYAGSGKNVTITAGKVNVITAGLPGGNSITNAIWLDAPKTGSGRITIHAPVNIAMTGGLGGNGIAIQKTNRWGESSYEAAASSKIIINGNVNIKGADNTVWGIPVNYENVYSRFNNAGILASVNDSEVQVNGNINFDVYGNGITVNAAGSKVSVGGGQITVPSGMNYGYYTLGAYQGTINVNTGIGGNTPGTADVNLNGDIFVLPTGTVNAAFTTADSRLHGIVDNGGTVNMWLRNGATWTNEARNTRYGEDNEDTGSNGASRITHFYGGNTAAGAGIINQKSDKAITIDHYSGNTTVNFGTLTQNGNGVTISAAADNSAITMSGDRSGLGETEAMERLAGKLTYTAYTSGERNLDGTVKLNEGLTARSVARTGRIDFNGATGKGRLGELSESPLMMKMMAVPSALRTSAVSPAGGLIPTSLPGGVAYILGDRETMMMRGAKSAMTTSMLSWRSGMTDMNQRLGDLRLGASSGMWARTYGGKVKYDKDKTNLSNSFWGAQVGADHKLGSGWHIGGAFDYNDGNAKYDFGGKGDPKLYVGSIYGTKVFDDGQYVDIVGKMGRAENDYTVYNAEGRKLDGDYHATGYGLSMEYGKRFGTATGYVEPQIQLLFSRLGSADYDAASDFDGDKKMHVHQDSMSSFIGRLGIAAGRATEKGNLYAKASILHEFKGDTAATFSAEGEDTSRVEQDFGDTWAELTLGGVYRLNGSNLFYANVTRGFGGDYKVEWKVNAGLRFAF